jgi:chromosome segregation ATPase
MTQQALPPSVDQQLAAARTATAQAIVRIGELEALGNAQRATIAQLEQERDALQKELDATSEEYAAIGREWLHVLDTLIEDAKVQYATAQDMDRRDLCFFWAGKQAGLRHLRTLAEEDAALLRAALAGRAGGGE